MVDNQVKAYVDQVDLFYLVIELYPLEYFKGIAVNIENFVGFNLSMATLHQRFCTRIKH